MLVCVLLGISVCFLGWFWDIIFMDFQTVSNLFNFLKTLEYLWIQILVSRVLALIQGQIHNPELCCLFPGHRKPNWRPKLEDVCHKPVTSFISFQEGKKHLFKNKQLESPLDNQIFQVSFDSLQNLRSNQCAVFLGFPTLRQHTLRTLKTQLVFFGQNQGLLSIQAECKTTKKTVGKHLEVKNERWAIFLLKYSMLNFG